MQLINRCTKIHDFSNCDGDGDDEGNDDYKEGEGDGDCKERRNADVEC